MAEETLNDGVIQLKFKNLEGDVDDIKVEIKDIKKDYLTIEVFKGKISPIEKIVYGLVGSVLVTVVAWILSLVRQ